MSPSGFSPSGFPTKIFMHYSLFHACYIPCPAHPSCLAKSTNYKASLYPPVSFFPHKTFYCRHASVLKKKYHKNIYIMTVIPGELDLSLKVDFDFRWLRPSICCVKCCYTLFSQILWFILIPLFKVIIEVKLLMLFFNFSHKFQYKNWYSCKDQSRSTY